MKAEKMLRELHRRNQQLSVTGWVNALLFVIVLCLSIVDERMVTGVNVWHKPIKFTLSIALFTWTMGCLLHYLPGSRGSVKFISWGIAAAMLTEIALIILQAARGVSSHFNNNTPFDATVFTIMGFAIMFNTLLVVYACGLYWIKKPDLPVTLTWGVRLGLTIFLLGSLFGGALVGNGGHSVGVPEADAGWCFLNWKKNGGDLRVAHFMGLHALQILPLTAYFFYTKWQHSKPTILTFLFAITYTGFVFFTFWQAKNGMPFV